MQKRGFRKLLAIVIAAICCTSVVAQDLHFSQYTEMPILRNPALTGNFNGDIRILTAHRQQWQSVSIPFKTTAIASEFKLIGGPCIGEDFSLTGGLQYIRDEAGDSKLTRNLYLLSLNARKQFSEDLYISLGFAGGAASNNFNFSGLKWGDQFVNGQYLPTNPTSQPMPSNGKNYFDLGAGISIGSNNNYYQWYLGYARYHDNKPKIGFGYDLDSYSILPVRQTISGGLGIRKDYTEVINFYGDFMYQNGHQQFMAGATYRWEFNNESGTDGDGQSFTAGAFYRHNDAIIPTVNIQWQKVSVGLSYDVNVSKLRTASEFRGGFELSLKFRGLVFSNNYDCGKTGCF